MASEYSKTNDDYLKEAIKINVEEFLNDDSRTTHPFPASFDKRQRSFIHKYAEDKELVSKSYGKDANRHVILYKSTYNSVIEATDTFNLTPNGRKLCIRYLREYPVSADDLDELRAFDGGARNRQNAVVNLPCCFSFNKHQNSCVPPNRANPSVKPIREGLPIFAYRERIIEAIEINQAVILTGNTGTGKSTQVPQYLIERYAETRRKCRIICTQPQSAAAVSISERVAFERGEPLGETVAYQIRLESCVSEKSNLIYTTSGFLLRCLISGTQNELFQSLSHIILDNVHDRDKNTDFLLIALKSSILNDNPTLKIILMSNTIDFARFSEHLGGCPVIEIPSGGFLPTLFYLPETIELIGFTQSLTQDPRTGTDIQHAVDQLLDECFQDNKESSFDHFFYLVIGEGVPVDLKHSQTEMTALMLAASKGYLATVNKLIVLGANPNTVGRNEMNAIQWACRLGQVECAEYLRSLPSLDLIQVDTKVGYSLICEFVQFVHRNKPPGNIMIFMSGYETLVELFDVLVHYINWNALGQHLSIFIIHSSLQPKDQPSLLANTSSNTRKVYLTTNISDSTSGIDDVEYVIDTGRIQQNTIDQETGLTSLAPSWISQANANQRMLRAGRTRPGACFRLYPKTIYDQMDPFTKPEILSASLNDVIINAKMISGNESIVDFISKAIEPPTAASVVQGIEHLQRIGALDQQENVTELGTTLVDLPVDIQLGKVLLYSILLKCLDPVLTIVSALSVKDPLIVPDALFERCARHVKQTLSCKTSSDHMVLLKIYHEWNESKSKKQDREFCRENFISNGCMHMICEMRGQILAHLRSLGLIQHRARGNIHELNRHSDNWAMVKACLTAGLYPNLSVIDRNAGKLKSRTDVKLIPHQSSVLREQNPNYCQENIMALNTDWVLFHEKLTAGHMCLIRQNTLVTSLSVALFAGSINLPERNLIPFRDGSDSEHEAELPSIESSNISKLIVDDWITMHLSTDDAYLVFHMRNKLNSMLLKMVKNPTKFIGSLENSWSGCVDTLAKILMIGENSYRLVQPRGVGLRPIGVVSTVDSGSSYAQDMPHQHIDVASNAVPDKKTPTTARFYVIHADSVEQVLHHLHNPMSWYWPKSVQDDLLITSYRYPNVELILFFYVAPQNMFFGASRFRNNYPQPHRSEVLSVKVLPVDQLSRIWFTSSTTQTSKTFSQTEQGEEITDRTAAEILFKKMM